MTTNWTPEIPVEAGTYWLLGWRSDTEYNRKPASLYIVKVHASGTSNWYVSDGAFLYPMLGLKGMWRKIQEPDDLPKFEPHFYIGVKVLVKSNPEVHIIEEVDRKKGSALVRADGKTHARTWVKFEDLEFHQED